MRSRLVRCIANIEAYIDFSEDQDVDDTVLQSVGEDVSALIRDISAHLDDHRRGERLRTGVRTAIIGAPNVGKSSFVNLLSNRKVSIVTNVAGTTRDIIESHHDIGGYPVILADTAGLRASTDDIVESEGIIRAKDYFQLADFIILMIDSEDLKEYFQKGDTYEHYLKHYLNSLGINNDTLFNTRSMVIVNKCDLLPESHLNSIKSNQNFTLLSCHTHLGLEAVLEEIISNLKHLCGNPSKECPNLSQQRHRYHLKQCVEFLEQHQRYVLEQRNPDLAIATQYLRSATRCIGKITGTIETEEILDVIFSTFCIGK